MALGGVFSARIAHMGLLMEIIESMRVAIYVQEAIASVQGALFTFSPFCLFTFQKALFYL